MAARPGAAQRIMEAVAQPIADLGLDLVDVEMVREGKAMILRIFIDKTGGVSMDDCTQVTHLVDPLIDTQLNIHEHDFLEVSSPGLERPLKTDRDFARYQGEWIELSRYKAVDGRKKLEGRLAPCTAETIGLELDDGTLLSIPRQEVARVKRLIRF